MARRIDWRAARQEAHHVDEQSIGKRGKLFRFLGFGITIAGEPPSASRTLAVKVCTTSLVIQCVSGERAQTMKTCESSRLC